MEDLLQLYSNNELQIAEVEKQISLAVADLQNKQQELTSKNEEIKEQIKKAMEEKDIKKFENDYIAITYVAPTTRNTVDSAKLKEKFADVYNQCLKTSDVKSSVRIKVKEYVEGIKEIKEVKEIEL
jgi:predicted phage-related endonuclease